MIDARTTETWKMDDFLQGLSISCYMDQLLASQIKETWAYQLPFDRSKDKSVIKINIEYFLLSAGTNIYISLNLKIFHEEMKHVAVLDKQWLLFVSFFPVHSFIYVFS